MVLSTSALEWLAKPGAYARRLLNRGGFVIHLPNESDQSYPVEAVEELIALRFVVREPTGKYSITPSGQTHVLACKPTS